MRLVWGDSALSPDKGGTWACRGDPSEVVPAGSCPFTRHPVQPMHQMHLQMRATGTAAAQKLDGCKQDSREPLLCCCSRCCAQRC